MYITPNHASAFSGAGRRAGLPPTVKGLAPAWDKRTPHRETTEVSSAQGRLLSLAQETMGTGCHLSPLAVTQAFILSLSSMDGPSKIQLAFPACRVSPFHHSLLFLPRDTLHSSKAALPRGCRFSGLPLSLHRVPGCGSGHPFSPPTQIPTFPSPATST